MRPNTSVKFMESVGAQKQIVNSLCYESDRVFYRKLFELNMTIKMPWSVVRHLPRLESILGETIRINDKFQ